MIGPIESSPMKLLRKLAAPPGALLVAVFLASPVERTVAETGSDQSSDSSWPREKYSDGTRLIIYQPQVDDWKKFPGPELANGDIAYTQGWKNGSRCGGNEGKHGRRQHRQGGRSSPIRRLPVPTFLRLDKATAEKMEELFKTFVPQTFSISLHSFDRVHAKEGGAGRCAIEQRSAQDFRGLPAVDFVERQWRACPFGSSKYEFEVRR